MNILNICLSAPFTERYSYQDNLLSEYQQKHGHKVTVLTTTRTRDDEGKIVTIESEDRVMENGVRLIRIPVANKLCQFFGIYRGIGAVLSDVQPDFIIIHGLASFIPRVAIRYRKTHPSAVIVADSHQDAGTTYTEKFPFNFQLWFFKHKWKRWIRYVDKIYGTTSWRKSFAKQYYGIPDEKLDVLIMGIDSDQLPDNFIQTRHIVRQSLQIDDKAFVFVTGGKLDKNKHTVEAMRAFSKTEDAHAVFLIFGAVLPEIQEEFYSLLNQDKRMKYIGYVSSQDVKQYFIASDFGLFPGRHSVLWEEAIGCGLPCVFHKYEEKDHTEICGNSIRLEVPTVEAIGEVLDDVLHTKGFS